MEIVSVEDYITKVNSETKWNAIRAVPWFRGLKSDPRYDLLLPKLYQGYEEKENQFVQDFRNLAYTFGEVPEFSRIDQWLFLMQHCGLPTRLLDWTENALAALYFSINEWKEDEKCIVYILNPLFLNFLSFSYFGFKLNWIGYRAESPIPIGNIRAAFQQNRIDMQSRYPIAIYPQHIHPRMSAQKGTFTVHGSDKLGLEKLMVGLDLEKFIKDVVKYEDMVESSKRFNFENVESFKEVLVTEYSEGKYLQRLDIKIDENLKDCYLFDLKKLGMSQSTLFPDLDGLAREIRMTKLSNMN